MPAMTATKTAPQPRTRTRRTYTCAERIYAGTALQPPEYCDNEVDEEEALCDQHNGSEEDEANERAFEAWKEKDLW